MITYFAVGAGKFISTFLGFPDIGKVVNTMDESETADMQFVMEGIGVSMTDANGKMMLLNADIPQQKSLNKAWVDVDKAWTSIKDEPGNLRAIKCFDVELSEYVIISKSTRSSIKQWMGTARGEHHDRLTFYINQVVDRGEQLNIIFNKSVEYKIIIKAQFLAALLMIILAMIYTVASGLYGVVWTDVFQGGLIFGTIVYICVLAFTKFSIPDVFSISIPMQDGTFQAIETTRDAWTGITPPWKLSFPAESTYSIYNLFGIAVIFYLIKVSIEGSGGTSGYMIQRYFAAKSDRDAGLLSLFWTFLLSFRWPFITAIAIMGVAYGAANGVISDPETVLPIVVNEMIPMGMKGLLVAGLMAAAMSTFDSTVNAGAAYWVKDIYQTYINPKADMKTLMRHSRWASIFIVTAGLLFSLAVKNINEIWGWITMSIGAGMMIPTLVRWYWWRLNGWGFAIGTATGMIAAVIQRMFFPGIPEYMAFIFAGGTSLIGMLIGTYATQPTDSDVLEKFYKITRPFGFWKPVRKTVNSVTLKQIDKENKRDKIAIFFAVPWQLTLFIMWITVMMKRWDLTIISLALVLVLSAGLYVFWYRHLSSEVKIEETSTV
ncbi:sodium:solute symporter [bacterium]|nr:sodium:solute symporter [bacterium]